MENCFFNLAILAGFPKLGGTEIVPGWAFPLLGWQLCKAVSSDSSLSVNTLENELVAYSKSTFSANIFTLLNTQLD